MVEEESGCKKDTDESALEFARRDSLEFCVRDIIDSLKELEEKNSASQPPPESWIHRIGRKLINTN